jgi:putative tributyrin esterase
MILRTLRGVYECDHNERFRDAARARGFDVTDDFRPGEHEWGLWDDAVQDVVRWLPLR